MNSFISISMFASVFNDYLKANKVTQKEINKLVRVINDPCTDPTEYDSAIDTIYWALYGPKSKNTKTNRQKNS